MDKDNTIGRPDTSELKPFLERLEGLFSKMDRVYDSVAEQYGFPEWLEVDSKAMSGVFKRFPERNDLPAEINEQLIVELYSK